MPEGLSADEVGKEIASHAAHGEGDEHDRRDRVIAIVEAVLLSIVTLLAAWSGYAAAKYSTDQRVNLADASGSRSQANRAYLQAVELRNFDSSTFEAWFAAYTVDNKKAMQIAERRFRPGFRVAFDAWRATNPETNPNAPPGPTYMQQYRQPGLRAAAALDRLADEQFAAGEEAGSRSDDYIRTTVFLASVLFLVGICTRFPLRTGRYALVGVGSVLLIVSFILLLQLPRPPI